MSHEAYALLTPEVVLGAVEASFGLRLTGVVTPFASYVNRVYGLRAEDGSEYVAKFYRPDRWSDDAILEEHEFLFDCADAELPVVAPLADEEGATLAAVEVDPQDWDAAPRIEGVPQDGRAYAPEGRSGKPEGVTPATPTEYRFALFPKRAGRTFDAERDEEWLRLGSLLGRLHAVGNVRRSPHRLVCRPDAATRRFVDELRDAGVVHPEPADAWFGLVEEALAMIAPLFEGVAMQRIHGDCHRGNILDRVDEGLLLIDFDDMLTGPPVQDLWLLLPERRGESGRELTMLLEGYETFLPFDRRTLDLIEPLRLMRIIYFLAWQARQRFDRRFRESNPNWGNEAFWIKEVEDLRAQLQAIREEWQ